MQRARQSALAPDSAIPGMHAVVSVKPVTVPNLVMTARDAIAPAAAATASAETTTVTQRQCGGYKEQTPYHAVAPSVAKTASCAVSAHIAHVQHCGGLTSVCPLQLVLPADDVVSPTRLAERVQDACAATAMRTPSFALFRDLGEHQQSTVTIAVTTRYDRATCLAGLETTPIPP